MHQSPIDVALQHVSETKHLLDALITSSESFDYPKAKLALKSLEMKSRELGKLRAKLIEEQTATAPQNLLRFPITPAHARL